MRVSEVYRAFQGEGLFIGQESVFVRLHGCPVHCVWCDSAFTWEGSEEGREVGIDDLIREIEQVGGVDRDPPCNIVITGGEPLIHKALPVLLEALGRADRTIEIETSGILPPPKAKPHWSRYWNVSPKLPSAEPRMLPDLNVLGQWRDEGTDCIRWKFVIADHDDWKAMRALVDVLGLVRDKVLLMPCARTAEELAAAQRWLLEGAAGSGFRVTTRLHTLAYGEERGR